MPEPPSAQLTGVTIVGVSQTTDRLLTLLSNRSTIAPV